MTDRLTSSSIDRLLDAARSRIAPRVQPGDLAAEIARGSLVVDIRPVEHRDRDGAVPGSIVVDRNVLEWRLDPTSPHRLPIAERPDRRVVLVCNEGYASSLAAAGLLDLGLTDATDLDGGAKAWLQHQSVQPKEETRG